MNPIYQQKLNQERFYPNNIIYYNQQIPIRLYNEIIEESNRRKHIGKYSSDLTSSEEYALLPPKPEENKYTVK